MVSILSTVINALVLSAIYALVSLGLTLIFSVGGVFNLAHGVNVTIGAFTAWYIGTELGLNIWIAVIPAIVLPALFSYAVYKGLIERVQNQPMTVMTVTLLIALIGEYLIRETIGIQSQSVPALFDGVAHLAGATVPFNRIAAFLITWSLIVGLIAVINYTRLGKAIVATSMSDRGSALVGIEKPKIQIGVWIVAGALAGIAGLFFGAMRTADWSMGMDTLVIAFPIVVLGGMGSIRGTLVAANIIGFLNVFIISYWNASLAKVVPVIVLILILLARPQGLFGRQVEA